MNTIRTVQWEHWQNPYGGNGPEFLSENTDIHDDIDDEKQIIVRPAVATPMGLVPIHPFRSFNEVFDFWIGHTNFHITDDLSETIEFSPGVEIFQVFTPYRFRICIGKLFKTSDVKYEIQKRLRALPNTVKETNDNSIKLTENVEGNVSKLKDTLDSSFKYWAIYVIPNGEIDIAGFNTKDGYDIQIQLYNKALELAGGIIYKNE